MVKLTQRQRLTLSYTVTIRDGVAELHHSPIFAWNFTTPKSFHKKRMKAYHKLARSRRTDISLVQGHSFWIDYTLDGFIQHAEPAQWKRDVMGLAPVWLVNAYNWRPGRVKKLIHLLHHGQVNVGEMEWDKFVQRFAN